MRLIRAQPPRSWVMSSVDSKGATEENLLTVEDLVVEFRTARRTTTAVDGVSFAIEAGETLALVGESGSGKSVTALSIMQLLPYPTAHHPRGSIKFKGEELIGAPAKTLSRIRGDEIGMIFQEPLSSLNPLHRVEKQIGEVLKLHRGLEGETARARTLELLELVGIRQPEKRLHAWPHQLSGGQRQRVMIAMALANEPQLLIADEPTTALDVTVQAQILELLGDLQRKLGMAMMLITHDLGVVEKISDRVCVMRHGKILESDATVRVFANPANKYTRSLLAAEPTPREIVSVPEHTQPSLVTAHHLRVWFPIKRGVLRRTVDHIKAVDDVSFSIKPAQTLGVVGESGCGKTSLALALLKLVPFTGDVAFASTPLQTLDKNALKRLRRRVQMVFQDPFASLSPRMTVGSIIAEGLDAHHLAKSDSEREDRVAEALRQVELEPDIQHRYPHEFSGGQRQRIAIARAAIVKPELIILDEPTSAVDRSVQAHIIELLLHLQESFNVSYLFISHDLKVVRALATDLIVMRNGRAVEQGPAASVFENPQRQYTRALIGAAFDLAVIDTGTKETEVEDTYFHSNRSTNSMTCF